MLGKILLFPVMGPISGLVWIGEQIQERTNTEFDAQENLHKQLLSLQLSFDIGEISEDDFEEQEEELLLRIQALEEQERLEAKTEEDEDKQSQFVAVSEENQILEEKFRLIAEYEEDENLVLSP